MRVKQRNIDKVPTIVTCKILTADFLTAKLVQSDSRIIQLGQLSSRMKQGTCRTKTVTEETEFKW